MDPINVYNRCMIDKPYTEDFKIYSKSYLQKVVAELQLLEEYEKCIELNKFINRRFPHLKDYSL